MQKWLLDEDEFKALFIVVLNASRLITWSEGSDEERDKRQEDCVNYLITNLLKNNLIGTEIKEQV